MWPFMLLGSVFALASIFGQRGKPHLVLWIGSCLILIVFIGLRHHVGMDWNNYLRMIDKVTLISTFEDFWIIAEPGYALLLLIGSLSGSGIYVTNLLGAIIFCVGLFVFARRTPEPWLALIVALPFFVVAFGMSANRQAIAAAIMLIVFAYWEDWSIRRKVAIILLAALFHSSAIIMLAFVGTSLRLPLLIKTFLIGIFVLIALYSLQVTGRIEYYDDAYGRGQTIQTQSSGALMHVALNAIPASAYILLPRLRKVLFPTKILRHMAIVAMLTIPLALVMSAAAGRVSLYWYPVSMMVFSALPQTVDANSRILVRCGIALLMMLELVVWLQFANSSSAHMPYQNALFVPEYALHIGIVR